MALKEFFQRKKEGKKEEKKEKTAPRKEEKVEKEAESVARSEKKLIPGEAYRILKSPHISEKATDLAQKNQYVFNVWERTTKPEIKKSIEGVYGVDVVSVKIVTIPRKKRRLGRMVGFKKGYKKAIIRIKEGQKIEVMPR